MFAAFCGPNVRGSVGPAKLKPVPETETCETVRLNLVALVMVMDLIKVLPNGTVPKLMLEEDALCPLAVEVSAIRAAIRNQQAGLKGELGQVIFIYSLSKYVPRRRAGEYRALFAVPINRFAQLRGSCDIRPKKDLCGGLRGTRTFDSKNSSCTYSEGHGKGDCSP